MSTNSLPLTRDSISAARTTLHPPHIHLTPVLTSTTLSALASSPRGSGTEGGGGGGGERPAQPTLRLWFKCENLQRGGSFKIRGAVYALERLLEEEGREGVEGAEEERIDGWVREKGVVTHSSGNHAQALALAARDHNLPAHIIMPSIATPQKIAAAKAYGARVYLSGSTYPEREALTRQVISATGARLISSCDHPDIILGQGTMGLEMEEQVSALMSSLNPYERGNLAGKGLDGIITPCGGGGMLSGVALSAEGTGVRVFGAEPSYQGADDGRRGFYAGERIEQVETMTVAEGLRVPVGRWPWGVIHGRGLVSGMYSVGEEEILAATRLVWERMKLVVEPSACVGLAVVLFDDEFRAMVEREAGEDGWDLGIVLSGGNVGGKAVSQMLSDESARL
ncbi:hypothetical protein E4U52_006671 [Claviceps spartinae]|nr:hypothetical protein E4U52_006671 [Claviceps spartinae]